MKKSTVMLFKAQNTKMSYVVSDKEDQLAACDSIFSAVVPSSNCTPAPESQTLMISSPTSPITTVQSIVTRSSSTDTVSSTTVLSHKEADPKLLMAGIFMNEKVGKCSQILKPLAALVQTSASCYHDPDPNTALRGQILAASAHDMIAVKQAVASQLSSSIRNANTASQPSLKGAEITQLPPNIPAENSVSEESYAPRNDVSLQCLSVITQHSQSTSVQNETISVKPQNQVLCSSPSLFSSEKSISEGGRDFVGCSGIATGHCLPAMRTSGQPMNAISFIPIIFTNAQGETQQITANDLPPEVLSQVSLDAVRSHVGSHKLREFSSSDPSLVTKASKSSKIDSLTGPETNDNKALANTPSISSVEKLNSAPSELPQSTSHVVGQQPQKLSPMKQQVISDVAYRDKCQQHSISNEDLQPLLTQPRSHGEDLMHSSLQQENQFVPEHNQTRVPMSNRRKIGIVSGTPSVKGNKKLSLGRPVVGNKSIQGETLAKHIENARAALNLQYNVEPVKPITGRIDDVNESKCSTLPNQTAKMKGCEEEFRSNFVEKVACFKCKFCLFLSMDEEAVAHHAQKEHTSHIPGENNFGLQCPGCINIFFSRRSLEVHLSEDHNTADQELKQILDSFGDIFDKFTNKKRKQPSPEPLKDVEPTQNSSDTIISPVDRQQVNWLKRFEEHKKKKVYKSYEQRQQLLSFDGAPADETGKIRVRKLSSLEKHANSVCGSVLDSSCSEDNVRQEIDDEEHESAAEFESSLLLSGLESTIMHSTLTIGTGVEEMNTPSSTVCNIREIPVQVPQVPIDLHEKPNVMNDERKQPDLENLQSGVVGKLSHTNQSEDSCDLMMEEAHVDECFPNDVPSYGVSTMRNEDDNDRENLDTTNIILEKPVSEELLTKNSVKRRGMKSRTRKQGRRQKNLMKTLQGSQIKQEQDITLGYRCTVLGCPVRLFSHDNMQYHLRCHDCMRDSTEAQTDAETSSGMKLKVRSRFSCPECSYRVRSWAQLTNHLWRCHSIDLELHSCDKCNYKTSSFSNMANIHKPIHGTDKPFLCDLCGKGFKTPKQLRNHKTVHVKKAKASAGQIDKCNVCSRSFVDARMLRNHIEAVHNKVRPYMCSECGHTAASRSSLKMHLRQHTGDRPYKCEECEYQTSDHNSLRRHKKRHTGEKPYKCPHCDYCSIQSSTFKSHLKSKHPGQGSGLLFSCSKCAFQTVNHEIYLAHVAEHETEISFLKLKSDGRLRNSASDSNFVLSSIAQQYPIFVSISTEDSEAAYDVSTIEAVVQNVSEAITPGSHIHLLYNSVLSDFSQQPNELVDDGAGTCEDTSSGASYVRSISRDLDEQQNVETTEELKYLLGEEQCA